MKKETRQKLFNYLSDELNVLALESQLNDIINIVNPNKEKLSLQERKISFITSIRQEFAREYPQELLKEFCDYWTEHSESATKMRFEKEKFFDFKKRLKRWLNNSRKYHGKQSETNIFDKVSEYFADFSK